MNQTSPEQLEIWSREDQGPLTRNIIFAFTIISFVCVSLRICTRLRYKVIGWEDYTITVATFFSIGTAVFQILQVNAGNGKHAVFVPFPQGLELILKYLFWSIICYNNALTFIKCSIVLQYRRIFTIREMRILLDGSLAICIAWGICTLFTSIFTCVPVYAYWDIARKATATCVKDDHLWFSNAAINIATDLLVAILPVKVIWGLHIPRRQRIALLGILSIGWFVCVVSILRLKAVIATSKHPDDRTYYSAPAAYWSSIEMNLGIVCASLPALKPLVVKIIPAFSTRYGSREYGSRECGGGRGFGRSARSYGLGSASMREADVELATKRANSEASSSSPRQETPKNIIYVTSQLEQRVEDMRIGDDESQKDLVTHSEAYVHR